MSEIRIEILFLRKIRFVKYFRSKFDLIENILDQNSIGQNICGFDSSLQEKEESSEIRFGKIFSNEV